MRPMFPGGYDGKRANPTLYRKTLSTAPASDVSMFKSR